MSLLDENVNNAFDFFERAAAQGNTLAMIQIANLLKEEDPEAYEAWLRRAANAGSDRAMTLLGLHIQDSNDEEARQWYEQAALLGNSSAMLRLGILDQERHPEKARTWYERSAKAGNNAAMRNLGNLLYEQGSIIGAMHWYTLAALAGAAEGLQGLRILSKVYGSESDWYKSLKNAEG